MTDAIDPATDRFLLAVAAVVVLAVTAPFLLSATIDAPAPGAAESAGVGPAGAERGATADDVTASEDGSEFVANDSGASAGGAGDTDVRIAIDASDTGGYVVPGREVVATVRVDDEPVENATLTVNGTALDATTPENGTLAVPIPGTESVTLTAETPGGATGERTLAPETDVTVDVVSVSRGDAATVEATIRGYDLRGADIRLEDDADTAAEAGADTAIEDDAGTETASGAATATEPSAGSATQVDASQTNETGVATVDVPSDAETLAVAVEYEELRETRSVALDLEVDVETLLPVAGSTVEAAATYGDVPAHGVDVYVLRGDATDDVDGAIADENPDVAGASGVANDWLPAASTATIVVTDGAETETVVLGGLLRNLTIGVVLGLSLLTGTVLTSLRVVRWLEGSDFGGYGPTPLGTALLRLGAAVVGGAAVLASIPARISVPRVGLPSLPRLRLPRLPDLSASSLSLPSLRLPSLALPSVSLSLGWLGGADLGRPSLGGADDGEATGTDREPVDPFAEEADDAVPELTHRELVRAAVRDLGRLAGVGRVETSTPGQIGRRATDRALPQDAVDAIVGTVREVEYGGDEPTAEDASRVRRAVRRLRDALDDGGDGA